jgi:hypothetical protein
MFPIVEENSNINLELTLFIKTMDLSIPKKELEEIESAIQSEESVVGIDAKKTHVIIIHMLHQIQQKLDDLEARIEKLEN